MKMHDMLNVKITISRGHPTRTRAPRSFRKLSKAYLFKLIQFICWDPSGNEVNGYPRSVSPEKVLRAAVTRTRGHLTTFYSSEF